MKTLKKILSSIALVLILVVGVVSLSACGEEPSAPAKFVANTSAKSIADTCLASIKTNLYNNDTLLKDKTEKSSGTANHYTLSEAQTLLNATIDYYVNVGSLNDISEVEKIKLGNETFSKEQKVSVSIGNSQFIYDVAFKVEDKKLYVAAPVFVFETTASGKVKINDEEFSLNLNPVSTEFDFSNPTITGGSSTIAPAPAGSDYNYTATIKDGTSLLNLSYEGANKQTDFLVTKKYLGGNLNSYGVTALESNSTLGFYMVNYPYPNPDPVNPAYNNLVWEYYVYNATKGLANVKIKLELAPELLAD